MEKKIKAIVLLSGGLDSSLATKIIINQNIELMALNFFTPFCRCNRKKGCNSVAKYFTEKIGIPIRRIFIGEEYFKIIKNPKYGYGKNLNPCIDCRILMLKKAKEIMKNENFSFIVTGEVLDQRPKSQTLKALKIIEKETGLEGLIVRPLSANLLPETIPEKMGWIDRNKLLAIKGKSRKMQIFLADFYGIKDYPCPAGGCLLTDPSFSKRMKNLIELGNVSLKNVELIKIGRYFKLTPTTILIIGRNESENKKILALKEIDDIIIRSEDSKVVAVFKGCINKNIKIFSSSIVARYIKNFDDYKKILIESKYGQEILNVKPIEEIPDKMYV
ncbi:MAG: tRNA 4-thiouridine(8) synthase ThiI [Candidatus Omnitrophica bacterium]|nr:tRNA 4-thiouridine(8) synthase ThiI [Candidatus Omnitrophota bacterium]